MSSKRLACIVIGDSTTDGIVIGYRDDVMRALHHALFQHFAMTGLGGQVTFHVAGSKGNVERHFFLTPDRPIHFMYSQGKFPPKSEDEVKRISELLRIGEIVHIPVEQSIANDELAKQFLRPDADATEE
ncbi:hypothetical protein [Brevibacterium otitidis]|uniref:Uncharacterized protein n=1 Tax=Brevibacterium otitidis TaxID=53364 RepID=A0ABV5X4F3_9MICO|nr:hypothetical protein GCM10023233_23030 [Brevibacterium otitidis]